MKALALGSAGLLVAALAVSALRADSKAPLPVAGYQAATDVPGAHELPDPNTDYRILFAVGQSAKAPGDVNPMLESLAMYVNTLAKYGVPASHRHIVVMFHQRSDDFDLVMSDAAFKARYGRENKNIPLIHALKQAGVDLRLCGQGLTARKIDASQVNPDIQVDLWAMVTITNLQTKGWVRVG